MDDGTATGPSVDVLEREALELQAQQDAAGWPELPDVIPDWVLEDRPLPEPPTCDCGCSCLLGVPATLPASAAEEPGWAVPGVTGLGPVDTLESLPPVSPSVATLQSTLSGLTTTDPASLPVAQALADGQALLELEQQLRLLNLRRTSDVQARGLFELVGFRSAGSWLRRHRPDGDCGDAQLAGRLRAWPQVRAAVEAQTVPLTAARQVLKALVQIAGRLDRPDEQIDQQPAQEVLPAIVQNALMLLLRHVQGLHEDDPRLQPLLTRATSILDTWMPDGAAAPVGSQTALVEAVMTWLAEQLPAHQLPAALDEIMVSLLPSTLEERAERARQRRRLALLLKPDGTGWTVSGELDLETGEQLFVALKAEAARDPRNPMDTAAWNDLSDADKTALREQGLTLTDLPTGHSDGPDSGLGARLPRSRGERLHDAFGRLLARYLEQGLGGTAGKVPVQIHVTLTEQAITGQPGAAPARADSGLLVPSSLVKRWWCDSSVTAFVMSLGGKALRVIHSQRTLTADERRALAAEGGDRCAGDGCCTGRSDPLVPIRPHHILGYAEDQITSLDETLPVCDTLHHDLHEGHKTVRLRDGRYLNEHGFTEKPSLFDTPPF